VPQTKKDRLLPKARALHAEGLSKPEIAAALGVAESTIYRWARHDEEAGDPWPKAQDDPPELDSPDALPPAERLYRKLHRRLEALVERGGADPEARGLEDRMLKLCRVLDYLRKGRDDLTERLRALKSFAAFCLRNLTEEEMDPVRKGIRLYVDELKREHS
jgi:hypothetical protein